MRSRESDLPLGMEDRPCGHPTASVVTPQEAARCRRYARTPGGRERGERPGDRSGRSSAPPSEGYRQNTPCPRPVFRPRRCPVARPHASIEFFLTRARTDPRHEGPLARPISGPLGNGSVDSRLVDGRLAMRVFRQEPAVPWHPRLESPEEAVQEAMIADFTLRTPCWPRERREDTVVARVCRERHGDGR
jgi:hypothetical protein